MQDDFEEAAEKIIEIMRETRAGICPIWQCGGDLEYLEERTNWQEPDLRCGSCGALWYLTKYKD